MIELIIILVVAIPCILCIVFADDPDVEFGAGSILATVCIIFGIILIIAQCVGIFQNISAEENIRSSHKREQLKKDQAKDVLAEMRQTLVIDYPQYEKDIIDKLSSPAGVQFLAVRYPDLNASKTFQQYATQVQSYKDAIYKIRADRIDDRQSIRENGRNPFMIEWLLP